jgi:hypothetical protein
MSKFVFVGMVPPFMYSSNFTDFKTFRKSRCIKVESLELILNFAIKSTLEVIEKRVLLICSISLFLSFTVTLQLTSAWSITTPHEPMEESFNEGNGDFLNVVIWKQKGRWLQNFRVIGFIFSLSSRDPVKQNKNCHLQSKIFCALWRCISPLSCTG